MSEGVREREGEAHEGKERRCDEKRGKRLLDHMGVKEKGKLGEGEKRK